MGRNKDSFGFVWFDFGYFCFLPKGCRNAKYNIPQETKKYTKKQKKEKKAMNKKHKSENGITLVALLVTIIIIVILAGVTIRGLTRE